MSSIPVTCPVTPGVAYRDAQAAITWLCEVLGFRLTLLYEEPDGRIAYAQLEWGSGAVEVSSRQENGRLPAAGPSSIVLTAASAVEVDRCYHTAIDAGAEIAISMEDTFFGSHGFSVLDPEGNQWHIGTAGTETDAARNLPGKVRIAGCE